MNELSITKITLTGILTGICYFLGGFDATLILLISCMVIDYITGIMNGIIKKKLSSKIGFKGIFKKIFIFMIVGLSTQLDSTLGINGIRYLTISFYIANEGISIIENATLLGCPVPKKIKNVLEQIKKESESE